MIHEFNFTWNDVLNASNLNIEKEEIKKIVFVNKAGLVWKVDDLDSKIGAQNFARFAYFANADEPFMLQFQNDTEAASIIEDMIKPVIDSEDSENNKDTKKYFLIRFLVQKIIKMQVGFETKNFIEAFSAKVRNRVISWKMGPVSKLIIKSLM